MNWLFDIIDRLLGIDILSEDVCGNPAARRRSRRDRATIGLFMLAISLHVAWVCGWLPGIPGMARMIDVQAADGELRQQVVGLRARVENVGDQVKEMLRIQMEERARGLKAERCRATTETARARLAREISVLQSSYRRLTGESLAVPDCEEAE